jgi:hypothetical protein
MTDPLPPTTPASSATSAPRARPRRAARLASLVVLAVGSLAAVASTGEENEAKRADEGSSGDPSGEASGETEAPATPEQFAVGDLVELGDWQVRVHGVTDPVVSTDEFFQPAAGQRWVAVDVEVTNTGDQAETVSSALCFEIMDDGNQAYMQTVTGTTTAATPDGEVAAGASRRGTVEYEVPADAAGLRLQFSCDLLASGTATIALGA